MIRCAHKLKNSQILIEYQSACRERVCCAHLKEELLQRFGQMLYHFLSFVHFRVNSLTGESDEMLQISARPVITDHLPN